MTGVHGQALKEFNGIRLKRNQGDPCTPEMLAEANFDGDEHLIRETAVLEVELVAHADKKSWFVFTVEIDGETVISQFCLNLWTIKMSDGQGFGCREQDRDAACSS